MRAELIIAYCLVAAAVLGLARPGASARPLPYSPDGPLPEPPAQHQPWVPPASDLPELLVSATGRLFEQGLADPRGCEYREVQVEVGNLWSGRADVLKTRGWVLPPAPRETQRFAVCWNGLVYPVVRVGEPADMSADVLAALDDHQRQGGAGRWRLDLAHPEYSGAVSEAQSATTNVFSPIRVCLLLRLGRADLAAKVWSIFDDSGETARQKSSDHRDDPYLTLANNWIGALFDRAVCSHMRGDDRLSLASARSLVDIAKVVEVEAERRGYKTYPGPDSIPGGKVTCLYYLRPLNALVADEERRVKEIPRPDPLKVNTASSSRGARIAALIGDLENVSVRQWGQPGGVDLGEDPIVRALIAQGDDAVEPLLHCLETDTRLTRSVSFGRDFKPERSLIGAHEAAYAALVGILHKPFIGFGSTADNLTERGLVGRRQVVAAIRAYWKRFKGVPLDERWYRTLQDDHAMGSEWLVAASNITQPWDVEVLPTTNAFTTIQTPGPNGQHRPGRRGDALRGKSNPTVSQLMARRAADLAARARVEAAGTDRDSQVEMARSQSMIEANDVALDLYAWDRAAALRALPNEIRLTQKMLLASPTGYDDPNFRVLQRQLAEMTAVTSGRKTEGARIRH